MNTHTIEEMSVDKYQNPIDLLDSRLNQLNKNKDINIQKEITVENESNIQSISQLASNQKLLNELEELKRKRLHQWSKGNCANEDNSYPYFDTNKVEQENFDNHITSNFHGSSGIYYNTSSNSNQPGKIESQYNSFGIKEENKMQNQLIAKFISTSSNYESNSAMYEQKKIQALKELDDIIASSEDELYGIKNQIAQLKATDEIKINQIYPHSSKKNQSLYDYEDSNYKFNQKKNKEIDFDKNEIEKYKNSSQNLLIQFQNSKLKSLGKHQPNKFSFASSDLHSTSRSQVDRQKFSLVDKVICIQRAIRRFLKSKKIKFNSHEKYSYELNPYSYENENQTRNDIDLQLTLTNIHNSKDNTITSLYGNNKNTVKKSQILELECNETGSINYSTQYALSLQNIREMKEKILKDVEKNISSYKYDKISKNQNFTFQESQEININNNFIKNQRPINNEQMLEKLKVERNDEYSPFESIISDENESNNFKNTSRSDIINSNTRKVVNLKNGSIMTERANANKSNSILIENESFYPQPYLKTRAAQFHNRIEEDCGYIHPENIKTAKTTILQFENEDLESQIKESINTYKNSHIKNQSNTYSSGLYDYSNSKSFDNSNADIIDMLTHRQTKDHIEFNIDDDSCEENESNGNMVALLNNSKKSEWIDVPLLTKEQTLKVANSLN